MKTKNRYEFAFSVGREDLITKEGFEKMRDAGVKAIELSFGGYDGLDFEKIKTFSDRSGVKLWSLHLPFMPFETIDVSSRNSEQRADNIRLLCGIMEKACDIGIDKFVVHASGEPVLPPEREERMKCSCDSLFSLSEFAKKRNALIAVENLPRTCLGNCSHEINRLTAVNDNLKICFDTNHLFEETHREFVGNLKKEIVTVHISDYDFVKEKHWLPTVGKIDWKEVTGLLDTVGYGGPFLYEVSFLQRTAEGEKELTLSDFRQNYENLFGENENL